VAKKADSSKPKDELVRSALLTVAGTTGAMRLSGKAGDPPALFPSASGANKAAIETLTDQARPLISVSGPAKSSTITLTGAGFSLIAESLPDEQVGKIAKGIAESLPTEEQVSFLEDLLPKIPTTAPDLEPLLARAVERKEAETAERVEAERKRAERREASRAALERCMAHLKSLQAGRVKELTELLLAAGGAVPKLTPAPPPSQKLPPKPSSEEDRDFRRDVAERLVSSWRDAVNMKKDEARRFIETALDNISGLRRMGEEGDEVQFDASLHEDIPGLPTGHLVKVTRSGWALEEEGDREYVIQKAQVAK
jgi:hypothetical protein